MKRIIALLIVLNFSLTLLVSCAKKKDQVTNTDKIDQNTESSYESEQSSSETSSLSDEELEDLWNDVSINVDSKDTNDSHKSDQDTSSKTESSKGSGISSESASSDKDEGFESWIPVTPRQ